MDAKGAGAAATDRSRILEHNLTSAFQLQAGLAWAILSDWGWRWLVAISSVPLLLLMLLYPLLPESPYWLLATGRTQEAQALLQRIAHMNRRELPSGRLQPASSITVKAFSDLESQATVSALSWDQTDTDMKFFYF